MTPPGFTLRATAEERALYGEGLARAVLRLRAHCLARENGTRVAAIFWPRFVRFDDYDIRVIEAPAHA